MISFDEIKAFFQKDLAQRACIEICFSVNGMPDYDDCWMGKMPDREDKTKDCFWFGLVPDGSQAYHFDNLDDFFSAPVFHGQSLQQVWKNVSVDIVDGGDPEYWFPAKNQIQP